MASPSPLDLLLQLPSNLGDPDGMRHKAARLGLAAERLYQVDRSLGRAAAAVPGYRGPAADGFHRALDARHGEVVALLQRLSAVQARLSRAATVVEGVQSEVDAVRRHITRDVDVLGHAAGRLVDDARRLAEDLWRL